MGDRPSGHTFRETDITLREYVDTQVTHAVQLGLMGRGHLDAQFDQKLDGLKELHVSELAAAKHILDERDKLYKERDDSRRTAVDAALAAVKEQTKSSFEASEKAIVKAEEAQKSYNASHNDLSRKMDEQYKSMTPQSEARLKWDATDKEMAEVRKDVISTRENANKEIGSLRDALMREIAGLRESRSETSGGHKQQADNRAVLALGFSGILLLLALATFMIARVNKADAPATPAPQVIYVPAPANTLLPTTPPAQVPR